MSRKALVLKAETVFTFKDDPRCTSTDLEEAIIMAREDWLVRSIVNEAAGDGSQPPTSWYDFAELIVGQRHNLEELFKAADELEFQVEIAPDERVSVNLYRETLEEGHQ